MLVAASNAWQLYDQVDPYFGSAVLAHSGLVKVIAPARVTTDERDLPRLAWLMAANLIRESWAAPQDVLELRAL